ncbi:MAG: hypothetical protein GYB67_04585 [Chloroflexi bacterium]|nr:hypothetical protein [Chloroflexota bacterium]
MSVKLLMNWDIKPGRDQEYFEFMVREWVPGIQKLNLQPTGSWYTVYSRSKEAPQIMTEAIAKDLGVMRQILDSDDWQGLYEKLQQYVHNYGQKIIHVTGGFQL